MPAQPASTTQDSGDGFVNQAELARRLGLHPRTVRRMTERGELPKPCLSLSGRPRWLWGYVVEFCRKRHEREAGVDRKLHNKLK